MKLLFFGFIAFVFSIGLMAVPPSYAHTTVEVEHYEIEAGWVVEPPIVGIRNDIIIKITEPGESQGSIKGVTHAFKSLDATVMFGGATKKIDLNSDLRPGYYFSPIIPTKTGSYSIDLNGDVDGTPVVIQIPIEDVESTAILDFPPRGSEGPADTTALKNAISSLQQDVSKLKTGETSVPATNGGMAYDFAIFGLSIAAAAIILAIIALVKRK